ncbi:MAG TPA: M20 family metallopeptidase [Solirubrobacteraceae bacterium]|jgi:amidohydrolase
MPRSTESADAPRSNPDLLARLLRGIDRELPAAIELRHRLHAQPELAHAEHRTAETIAAALPVTAQAAAGTGLIARVGPADGPAVALRAELDGLPIHELTGASFSATGDAMHACGHDVHMAALVALARAAHILGEEPRAGGGEGLPAALLTVFQPSEEAYPSGAEQLAHGELAALAPAAVVAAHIHPQLPWGAVALDAGAVNASCDAVEITVEGEPTHGAYPHHGRDPILAIAQIVVALHALLARRIDPHAPVVLTVGVIEGGSAENVIPSRARARAALRAYRPEDRRELARMVQEVVSGIAAAHGCRGLVELVPGEPALQNDAAIVGRARALLADAGLAPAPEWRSSGSDDFAFFGALAPLAMAFVGLDGAEGFQARPLHHPELLVPDAAVGAVARAQAVLYVAAAAEHARG